MSNTKVRFGKNYNFEIILLSWGFMILAACTRFAAPLPEPEQVIPPSPPPLTAPIIVQPSQTGEPTIAPTATGVPQTPAKPESSNAGNADILFVRASLDPSGNAWTFQVTVSHPDTGWEDYADGWDVMTPDGTVIKPDPTSPFTRLLLHPHETEQPFTRSQSGIIIPADVDLVIVRAHDLVTGFGGKEVEVNLTQPEGSGFEVLR
jgi:hypothetical protein